MTLVRGEHPDAEQDTPASLVLRERTEPHLIEVLSDRIDQLAFSLDRDTGIDGELLTAVGELGGQIETLGTVTSREIEQVASQIEAIHRKISEDLQTSHSFQSLRDSLAEESQRLSDLIAASAQRPDPTLDIAPIRQALARFLTRILAALKRRAETQDNAQNELKKGVEAISKRLDEGLTDEATLREMIAPILGSAMDDLQASQAKMTESLSTLERRRPKQPDLKPLQSSMNDFYSEIGNLSKRIESFEQGIADRFERLETLISAATKNPIDINAVEARLAEAIAASFAGEQAPILDRILEKLSEFSTLNELILKRLSGQIGEHNFSPAMLIKIEDRLSHRISKVANDVAFPPDLVRSVEQVEIALRSLSSLREEGDEVWKSHLETILNSIPASEARISSRLTELREVLSELQQQSLEHVNSKEKAACGDELSEGVLETPVHQAVSAAFDQLASYVAVQGDESNPQQVTVARDLRFAVAEVLANAERQLQLK